MRSVFWRSSNFFAQLRNPSGASGTNSQDCLVASSTSARPGLSACLQKTPLISSGIMTCDLLRGCREFGAEAGSRAVQRTGKRVLALYSV